MIAHDLIDLSAPRRLHLIGIGGSGMAPFAGLLRCAGHRVTGADAVENDNVRRLRADGVRVLVGPESDVVPLDAEAVVHTAAVPADAAPLLQARDAGIAVMKYARAVGLFAAGRRTCAVAGTHGKTTTTGLLAYLLQRAGREPSFLVGGAVPQLPGVGAGASDLFVVEACEYDRSFLHLEPECAILTNIEADHLDYYRDVVEITTAFRQFATQVDRLLVIHESLRESIGRAGGIRARVITYGPSPDAQVRVLPGDRHTFYLGRRRFKLGVPGFHNVLNAAAVLVLLRELGVDLDVAAGALERFRGVGRRLEMVGRPRGVPVIDDYAHHPTEVEAGLKALRDEYAPRRLWVVFQPHQYSRLRRFLPQFAQALAAADRVVIPDIYAARDAEEDRRAVSPGDLVAAVEGCGGHAVHIPDFAGIVDFVRTQARAGDVVVTMGAGNVGDVAGRLAAAL